MYDSRLKYCYLIRRNKMRGFLSGVATISGFAAIVVVLRAGM